MKWMGLNELRESFLHFYETKEHTRLPSFSLVPKDDNSLLLINSGMAPMKKFFMGEVTPPSKRVTTCQKCIRNNDIDNVGITSRHLTYFEMLGNFSFGDYFKPQAIAWAWEFFTETLKIPKELLHISVYLEDDDAYDIWTKEIGIDPSHMVRLGKEDNFWEHGTGPCGPCSEIYFDRGDDTGCGKPTCAAGCECDRFVEVGNIVFSQFESDGKGTYTPLAKPNIDFGMGLERLACVVQGVDNVFEIDTMQAIISHIAKIAGTEYKVDDKKDVSIKVIADHIRSITFMTGDGVMGSNEGRGYVLRRLIRRAARHGKLLGIQGVFLTDVAETVIEINQSAYPELGEKREMILNLIRNEEDSFSRTIDQGLSILNNIVEKLDSKTLSGDDAFLLNDTYGFPLDLTREILAEKNIEVDEERFGELMKQQKERARQARKDSDTDAWAGESDAAEHLAATEFVGYHEWMSESKIVAMIQGGALVESASAGDDIIVVLDKTPFYAEGGGQTADIGVMMCGGAKLNIVGVTKNSVGVFLHRATVESGTIKTGDNINALIDANYRNAVMRNHTAAHLLQAALRQVLGEHVEQAGQLVNAKHVRFDFTHFSALTAEETAQIEGKVNEVILQALPVTVAEMSVEEAKKAGAMALFGEKYGDVVRMVSAGEFSKELCGGTHVDNTSKIGLFKIVTESSVASGVRRIEGVTGEGVLDLIGSYQNMIAAAVKSLKIGNYSALPTRIATLLTELREKDKMIESLNAKLASGNVESLFQNAEDVGGIKVITATFNDIEAEALKVMCDKVKDKQEPTVAVLAGKNAEKIMLVAGANQAAQKLGVKAGNLVKEVAVLTDGNGGGRPDFAMAGAKDESKLSAALAEVHTIVKAMLG
ncbi:alanine--tRNA ligase [Scatolibacter rhodanostii]|uniref:alanine--tRNA ligase n=1 Tax=Scatolibacter rhodanostii TaxID=2014781 RepID=UPI000C0761B2|nr:alanine--tRNA ligase [Scatolibacter rhodanostii]